MSRGVAGLVPSAPRARMATQLGVGFGLDDEPSPDVKIAAAAVTAAPPAGASAAAAPVVTLVPAGSSDDAADDGWNPDDAETVTGMPAAVPTPAPTPVSPVPTLAAAASTPAADARAPAPTPVAPPAVPRKPTASPAKRDAEQTSPQPALTMSTGMREEVWAIVRAAVADALAPAAARSKELEERLAKAERALEQERASRVELVANAQAAVAAATAQAMTSIPIALGPSVAPAAMPVAALAPPRAPRIEAVAAPVRVPGGSIPPTGFGVVVSEGPKRTLDIPAPHKVTEIELPDFGRGRRRMGRVVVGLMLLGVAGAIVAMILSRV